MNNVIIYRSSWEQGADQFWSDNPEFIIYFFVGALVVVAVWWAKNKFNK